MSDGYIHIVAWDRFQHRDAGRSNVPPWIRNYTELLSNDAYLELTGHERAVLHGLWLEYARSRRQLAANTVSLTRRLNLRVSSLQLKALNRAGFITLSASKVAGVEERRVEESKPPTGPPRIHDAFLTLTGIEKPGYDETKFTRERFDRLAAQNPHADLQVEAEALRDWEIHGTGAKQETKDGITRFRNWLTRSQTPQTYQNQLETEIDYPLLPGVAPR